MQVDSKESVFDEGLDVNALILTLWRQKIVILCVSLLVAILAAAYAFLAVPVYEAKAFIIPPTRNDIEILNYGRTAANDLAPLTVKDVYTVFIRNLQAESLRRDFFNDTYLPATGKHEDPKGVLYEKLSKDLSISIVGKDAGDRYSLAIQNTKPELAVKWVQLYVDRAGELAAKEINQNISGEAGIHARNLFQKVLSLREVAEKARNDAIVRLREALVVAKAIGLEKPAVINSNSSNSLGLSGNMSGELSYMRGTKALEAELANLEARKSDDPFIFKLRDVETKYNFYKQLEANFQEAKVFRLDGVIEVPDAPVKPKKALIIIGGLILGFMLGVVIALFRSSLTINSDRVKERV